MKNMFWYFIVLNRLSDSQKKGMLYNYNNSTKHKALKNDIQKKLQTLKLGGYNIDEFSYSLDNLLTKEKKKKVNLNKERNLLREIINANYNHNNYAKNNSKKKNFDNRRSYNKSKRLFTSYSNINIIYHDKRKKTPINSIKSKIDTLEFINKIKKRISPDKKIILNTHINNNYHNEEYNNLESNNNKHIITDYIKIKKKERKENEIKNKERINKENFKKYKNFLRLQENIKDSIINRKKIEEEKEKEKFDEQKIEFLDNTNKSSIFNEKEYYINCYEAQNIYKDNYKNINCNHERNNLSESVECNINLSKIRNKKIKTKNQFCNNYLIKNDSEGKFTKLFNKIHISNLLIKKNSTKNKNKNGNKYKSFIEKIFFILVNVIKRKYFKLFRYNYIILKIINIIKKNVFSLLKQNDKAKRIINLILYKFISIFIK